jgi:hypothetical protein
VCVMVRDKTLDRALDRLRRPGATLTLTYTRETVSGRSFHIQPDGVRIADETAQRLLEHPRVQPCDDGLFPGCAQSWRLGDWRKWTR